jgi:hypothetical protein
MTYPGRNVPQPDLRILWEDAVTRLNHADGHAQALLDHRSLPNQRLISKFLSEYIIDRRN